MTEIALIALVAGSLTVTAVCRRFGVPPPLVLVVVGLLASFLPGVTAFQFDPDVVLLVVLTPLLYSAALESSYLGIRANLRPILLLAVGLVIFTTLVVGLVAWWLIPGLSLPAAMVLGAVVAPPDAVAAVAVGRRLGLPRRVMTILAGESLFNDATALTLFRVAIAAAVGTGISALDAAWMFLWAVLGGVAVGLALGWLVHRIRRKLDDPLVESAMGLVVPFAAYLAAEEVHASGVLAVVVAGLYLGHHAPESGFATRLQDTAVWRASDTVLESVVFALIGLQFTAVSAAAGGDLGQLLLLGVVITAATVLARAAWVFPASYTPRLLFSGVRAREPALPWQIPTVVSWAGMRGAVTVAAAFAIPPEVPQRDVLVFVAFFVTVATLLLHGTTLPWMIRTLGVRGPDRSADLLVEAEALHATVQASLRRLDELGDGDPVRQHVARKLHAFAELRANSAWERLGRPADESGESPGATYRRLRREMLEAERVTLVALRDERRIDDEVLRRIMHELDLEEAILARYDDEPV